MIRCCKACRGTTSACAENTQHVEPCKLFRRNYLRVRGEYDSTYTHAGVLPELPPRARRILHDESHVTHLIGTTSACAENTGCGLKTFGYAGNYLRVRGEYHGHSLQSLRMAELPPRARRILGIVLAGVDIPGTTSACAENTASLRKPTPPARNYLRVRGEYLVFAFLIVCDWELPPRARRIQVLVSCSDTPRGTTSACAENTFSRAVQHGATRNYLRVRGEYLLEANSGPDRLELPPRARRIQLPTMWGWPVLGTTSACAENTVHGACGNNTRRNYLRVRGEYRRCRPRCSFVRELPPRARRIRQRSRRPHRARGTTSACAENTRFYAAQTGCIRNYLRVRGEYPAQLCAIFRSTELPPRARRIPYAVPHATASHGTTSACAENTTPAPQIIHVWWNYLRVRGEYFCRVTEKFSR